MTTNYNAPQSQYNKTDFGKLSVAESKTITFSEAIHQGNDERIQILAWVTTLPDAKNFDDKGFVFEPQACIFDILLKPSTYKDKTTNPTPAMLVLAHKLKDVTPGTPFSGSVNFSMNDFDAEVIISNTAQGKACPPGLQEMMTTANCSIQPIEKLDKLEGKVLPEMKKGGSWGGSKGESVSERIAARIIFLNKVIADPTQLAELLAVGGLTQEQFVQSAMLRLLD